MTAGSFLHVSSKIGRSSQLRDLRPCDTYREGKLYAPKSYIYLADKRQELHYTQFFRVARKAGIVSPDTELKFIGFGTMNGSDGKPFKTRQGGVLRLEYLIKEIEDKVYEKSWLTVPWMRVKPEIQLRW